MAKAASLADTLGKHLECAVCLDQYNEPKFLPCLHTFCKRCLQGLLTHERGVWKLVCPTCRSSAEVSLNLFELNFSEGLEVGRRFALYACAALAAWTRTAWTELFSSEASGPSNELF